MTSPMLGPTVQSSVPTAIHFCDSARALHAEALSSTSSGAAILRLRLVRRRLPCSQVPLARGEVPERRGMMMLPEAEPGGAQCDIDTDLSLHRHGLQGNRSVRAPDERVGADTETDRNVTACADVVARERPRSKAARWRVNCPREPAARADAKIE